MKRTLPKKPLLILGTALLFAALIAGGLKFKDVFYTGDPAPKGDSEEQIAEEETPEQTPAESDPEPTEETPAPKPPASTPNPPAPISNSPDSVGSIWWVVNKTRPLNPKTYVPSNLVTPSVKKRTQDSTMRIRGDVAGPVQQLFAAAGAAGYDPMFSSGYRSYQVQTSLYNNYVASDGQAAADTYSARPGYSEHQTGLAFDICNAGGCSLEAEFANTGLGQWVAAHAHEYGFTIRYRSGKQHITGYTYEPWHLRYVGKDLAAQLYQSDKTLEEHFGLPAAPNYP